MQRTACPQKPRHRLFHEQRKPFAACSSLLVGGCRHRDWWRRRLLRQRAGRTAAGAVAAAPASRTALCRAAKPGDRRWARIHRRANAPPLSTLLVRGLGQAARIAPLTQAPSRRRNAGRHKENRRDQREEQGTSATALLRHHHCVTIGIAPIAPSRQGSLGVHDWRMASRGLACDRPLPCCTQVFGKARPQPRAGRLRDSATLPDSASPTPFLPPRGIPPKNHKIHSGPAATQVGCWATPEKSKKHPVYAFYHSPKMAGYSVEFKARRRSNTTHSPPIQTGLTLSACALKLRSLRLQTSPSVVSHHGILILRLLGWLLQKK
jgi:hypothetical protein